MIPIPRDVAELVGDWAEGVENRSLLHEKFALPKSWGLGADSKLNDAGRWSVLRIVTRGSDLLRGDAERLRREAGGRNTRPDVAERKQRDADVARSMSNIAKAGNGLSQAANENARRFLADLAKTYGGAVVTFEAHLGARMMVNLAGGVVENAGIALDRCFGMPFIPGSALKGITRSQALWEIHEASPAEKPSLLRTAMLVFGYGEHNLRGDLAWAGGPEAAKAAATSIGSDDFKGCASFLPAYPTSAPTLVVDMVNPHYPEYYGGRRPRAEDNESPIPNYFPAVEQGASFGFALVLNRLPEGCGVSREALLKQARDWMERAITRKGVGAKTAAGYGWFQLGAKAHAGAPPTATTVVAEAPKSAADLVIAQFRSLSARENFPAALPKLAALPDPELRKAFDALVPAGERARLKKANPYWQAFTSGKAGADGQKILARLAIKLS